jgi:uncharacterized membrane protein (UPF0127 family)
MRTRGERSLRLVHPATGRVLAARLAKPRTAFGRGLGLMFRRSLSSGEGMWIAPCSGIHTFFMRFAIDVVFLDRGQRVVRAYEALGRWRMVPLVIGAHSVVELPAGALRGLELGRGEQLAVEGAGSTGITVAGDAAP